MNPLKQKQYQLLKDTGNEDLANKVNELVDKFNGLKPKEAREEDDDIADIAERIWDADTTFDAKKILEVYLKKLKK